VVCDCPLQQGGKAPAVCIKFIEEAHPESAVSLSGINREADDGVVVLISAMSAQYDASAAAAALGCLHPETELDKSVSGCKPSRLEQTILML